MGLQTNSLVPGGDHHQHQTTANLSDHTNNTDHIEDDGGMNIELYMRLGSYYVATLIIIGIFGNACSFILFSTTRRLKRIPSSQYLAALSLTDFTFVTCLSLIWLKSVGVNWQDSTVICPVSIFLSNTSCLLSGWYIMALTAEMTLAIVDPYRARRYCSRGLVAKRIIGIACFGCLINVWTLIIARSVPLAIEDEEELKADLVDVTNSSKRSNGTRDASSSSSSSSLDSNAIFTHVQEVRLECSFRPENEHHYNNLTILDSVISFSVPLLITLALNITIGCFLLRSLAKRQNLVARKFSDNVIATSTSALAVAVASATTTLRRKSLVGSKTSTASVTSEVAVDMSTRRRQLLAPLLSTNSVDVTGNNNNNACTSTLLRRRGRSRATLVSSLLISKSLLYLILNLPNYVHRLWQMTRTSTTSEEDEHFEREKLIQLIVYLLFYTQYSLNFFIYSMHACKTACKPKNGRSSSDRRRLRLIQ